MKKPSGSVPARKSNSHAAVRADDSKTASAASENEMCREAIDRMERSDHFRIVAFGASNTERYMPCLHWTDVLAVGLLSRYGRKFHIINSGISGDNTRDAMKRFSRDVEFFKPDIVIVTLGGNDCSQEPEKFVPKQEFSMNLDAITARIRDLKATPILQTYYQMDLEAMPPAKARAFVRNMELVREAARRNGVYLVDQFKLFDSLDKTLLRYKLLLNPMHVNEAGNTLIGVHLISHLDVDPTRIAHREKLLPALEILADARRAARVRTESV